MKEIHKWYLKWYYGYKNFWDELLALGVIKYLFAKNPLKVLYIEVDDVDRFLTRLHRHEYYLWDILCKLKLVSKHRKLEVIRYSLLSPDIHIFLWGGEVFTPARGWFHWWRNMFILYHMQFFRGNVTILWWISVATTWRCKLLYSLTLRRARLLILREQYSYDYVVNTYDLRYKAVLYHDFWYDVVDSLRLSILTEKDMASKTWLLCPYLLVNANPYVDMSILTKLVSTLTNARVSTSVVYFPCAQEDIALFEVFVANNVDTIVTLFDWTKHDMLTVISVYKYAYRGVWIRLHFLAMLYWMGVGYDYVVYQEKVEKFFKNVS